MDLGEGFGTGRLWGQLVCCRHVEREGQTVHSVVVDRGLGSRPSLLALLEHTYHHLQGKGVSSKSAIKFAESGYLHRPPPCLPPPLLPP